MVFSLVGFNLYTSRTQICDGECAKYYQSLHCIDNAKKDGMKKHILVIVVACAMMLACLAGCSNTNQAENAQAQNRQYMSSVNQIMNKLSGEMEDFAAAVKDDEVLSLSSQLSVVTDCVEELKALDVPEAMKDIHSSYVTGAEEMQTALQLYVSLYQDVEVPKKGSFDYSTYNKRLSEIQDHYNKGVSALEEADKKASEA